MLVRRACLEVEKFRIILNRLQEDGSVKRMIYTGRRGYSGLYCRIDLTHGPVRVKMGSRSFRRLSEDAKYLLTNFVGNVTVSKMPFCMIDKLPEEYHNWMCLHGLYVDPDHRNAGLGDRLVEEAKRFAQNHQKPVLLKPDPDSAYLEKLIRLYKRNGFQELDDAKGFLGYDGGKAE